MITIDDINDTQRAFATFTFQTWFYDTIYRR